VYPNEIIPDRVEGDHVPVVLDLLGERISQPGEAPIVHPDGQIAAHDIAGRNIVALRIAGDLRLLCAGTFGGAVLVLRPLVWAFSVKLDQLRIVHVNAKSIVDSTQVGFVPVRRELDAVSEA
jgi:hypothetical protein